MANTALLVMNVQKAHTDWCYDPGYVPRLVEAVRIARDAGIPVVHVVLGFRSGHPEVHPRHRLFGSLDPESCTPADPGAAIHPDLTPHPGDVVVTTRRMSAFAGSDLELILRAGDIDHLILSGLATSAVVLSTFQTAADLDYRMTVISDACYDIDPDAHQFLTEKLFPRQAEVRTIEDWAASIGLPSVS